jgi:hypothetical protein
MNYESEKNEVISLSEKGFSSRNIAKKLGISKSKAHNIIRDNRMSITAKGQEQNTSTNSNLPPQTMSTMSTNPQNNVSTTSTNPLNSVSILSKVPKNVAFLVENLVSPAHIQLSEQERYDETKFFISIVNYHLESKRIYEEFINTIDYLFYNSVLSFEEVDEYIFKLKAIAKDTDKLLSIATTGNLKDDRFRLTFLYANSMVRYMYSMKGACKMEGEQFCEIQDNIKGTMEKWLTLDINKAFPFTYDNDCEEVESNFIL